MLLTTYYETPLGKMMLASDGESLVAIKFVGQKRFSSIMAGEMLEEPRLPIFASTKHWLERYFSGQKPPISDLKLAPKGGEFRMVVWNILREIPYGKIQPYGQIAKEVAARMGIEKMSAQAVGGAVGHNPISIIIPCHRVVGANGNLTGFGGGIPRKIKLLEHEGVDMSKLYIPTKGTAL